MTWSAELLRTAWVDLVYSAEGHEVLRAVARRYGIAPAAHDDLRQNWIVSLDRTVRRDPGLVERVGDLDAARRYAFRTLRNRALDLLRASRARLDDVVDADGDGHSVLDRAAAPGAVDDAVLAAGSLAELRVAISDRLVAGELRCGGCRPAVVAEVALAVVDAYFQPARDGHLHLAGGTSELDGLLYEGLRRAVPDAVELDDQGRASERTRQLKSRCGRCVTALLAEILSGRHTDGGAIAGTGMSDRDHSTADRTSSAGRAGGTGRP